MSTKKFSTLFFARFSFSRFELSSLSSAWRTHTKLPRMSIWSVYNSCSVVSKAIFDGLACFNVPEENVTTRGQHYLDIFMLSRATFYQYTIDNPLKLQRLSCFFLFMFFKYIPYYLHYIQYIIYSIYRNLTTIRLRFAGLRFSKQIAEPSP